MTVLALLLSMTSLITLTLYVYSKNNIDRLVDQSQMNFQMEMYRLKICYDNDIKPCSLEAIQEFNKKNNYQ